MCRGRQREKELPHPPCVRRPAQAHQGLAGQGEPTLKFEAQPEGLGDSCPMQVQRHPLGLSRGLCQLTPAFAGGWGVGKAWGISCLASLLPTPAPGAFHKAQARYF